MPRQPINTPHAPAAIGPYSQAVRSGNTVYLSGQTPLDPASGQLIEGDIAVQARRAFDNLRAVCEAAGGSFDDIVRLGLYLTDLGDFAKVNAVMAEYFAEQNPVCKKCHRTATPVLPCEQRLADAIIRVQDDDQIPDWLRKGT